jgi:hypothetical protein
MMLADQRKIAIVFCSGPRSDALCHFELDHKSQVIDRQVDAEELFYNDGGNIIG